MLSNLRTSLTSEGFVQKTKQDVSVV